MTTHFITAEVDVSESNVDLQVAIEAKLQEQGDPLRWAVTAVAGNQAQVEAVITRDSESVTVD